MATKKGSTMSSGLSKVHAANRLAKQPAINDAKRSRLIARLKLFGATGEMTEAIETLRKRLHPFITKPKVKVVARTENQKVLIEALGGEDAYTHVKNKINQKKRHERKKEKRKGQ